MTVTRIKMAKTSMTPAEEAEMNVKTILMNRFKYYILCKSMGTLSSALYGIRLRIIACFLFLVFDL